MKRKMLLIAGIAASLVIAGTAGLYAANRASIATHTDKPVECSSCEGCSK